MGMQINNKLQFLTSTQKKSIQQDSSANALIQKLNDSVTDKGHELIVKDAAGAVSLIDIEDYLSNKVKIAPGSSAQLSLELAGGKSVVIPISELNKENLISTLDQVLARHQDKHIQSEDINQIFSPLVNNIRQSLQGDIRSSAFLGLDKLLESYHPEAPIGDKLAYIDKLQQKLVALSQVKGLPEAELEARLGELIDTVQMVWEDLDAGLEQTEGAKIGETMALTTQSWEVLVRQPETLPAAYDKLSGIETRLAETGKAISQLQLRKETAIKLLDIGSLQGLTPEKLAAAQQKFQDDPKALAGLMEALKLLETVDAQLGYLLEINDLLRQEQGALGTQLQEKLNSLMQSDGMPRSQRVKGGSSQELMAGLEALSDHLRIYKSVKTPQDVEGLFQVRERKMLLDKVFKPMLTGTLGYEQSQLTALGIPGDAWHSEADTAKLVSLLRKELGLSDEPVGQLQPRELQEFQHLLGGMPLNRPQGPLVKALTEKRQQMAVFTEKDVQSLIYVTGGTREYTAEQLLQRAQSGELESEDREAILKLFSPNGSGQLQPNELFKLLSDGMRLNAGSVRDIRKQLELCDGKLLVAAVRDQRSEAQALSEAFKHHHWIDTGTDEDGVLDILRDKSPEELMSLRLAYQAEYKQDIVSALRDEMSGAYLAEALHCLSRTTPQELQHKLVPPQNPLECLKAKDVAWLALHFEAAPELLKQAKAVFDDFQVSASSAAKQDLALQFNELWTAARLKTQLETALIEQKGNQKYSVDLLGFQVWSNEIDFSQVSPAKQEALALYQKFVAAGPDRKAQFLQEFLAKTTAAQNAYDLEIKKHSANLDALIDNLGTAKEITKTIAVVSAATVVSLATFGMGTAAGGGMLLTYGGSFVAGTAAGTMMGGGLEAYDQFMSKGHVDFESWSEATYNHFKTSATTAFGGVVGKGVGQAGEFINTLKHSSKFWGTLAKHPQMVQTVLGGATNVTTDSAGRIVMGQDIDLQRMAFAFAQGAFTSKVSSLNAQGKGVLNAGKNLALNTTAGLGSEALYAAAKGEDFNVTQALINTVAVSVFSHSFNHRFTGLTQKQALKTQALDTLQQNHNLSKQQVRQIRHLGVDPEGYGKLLSKFPQAELDAQMAVFGKQSKSALASLEKLIGADVNQATAAKLVKGAFQKAGSQGLKQLADVDPKVFKRLLETEPMMPPREIEALLVGHGKDAKTALTLLDKLMSQGVPKQQAKEFLAFHKGKLDAIKNLPDQELLGYSKKHQTLVKAHPEKFPNRTITSKDPLPPADQKIIAAIKAKKAAGQPLTPEDYKHVAQDLQSQIDKVLRAYNNGDLSVEQAVLKLGPDGEIGKMIQELGDYRVKTVSGPDQVFDVSLGAQGKPPARALASLAKNTAEDVILDEVTIPTLKLKEGQSFEHPNAKVALENNLANRAEEFYHVVQRLREQADIPDGISSYAYQRGETNYPFHKEGDVVARILEMMPKMQKSNFESLRERYRGTSDDAMSRQEALRQHSQQVAK
ncbi:MAG: hypothetical protein ACAI44_21935 [Candidatus Sericytochromatia bacterium]